MFLASGNDTAATVDAQAQLTSPLTDLDSIEGDNCGSNNIIVKVNTVIKTIEVHYTNLSLSSRTVVIAKLHIKC